MATRNQTALAERADLKILRRRQVEARTGLPRSTIYAGVNAGTFPKPIKLGVQSVGWLESSINNWIEERIAAARGIELIVKRAEANDAAIVAQADKTAALTDAVIKSALSVD